MERGSRKSVVDDAQFIARRRGEILRDEGHPVCERCGTSFGVSRGTRGTAYNFDGKIGAPDDPNYATLCDGCWPEERTYWEDMWREYYGGRL